MTDRVLRRTYDIGVSPFRYQATSRQIGQERQAALRSTRSWVRAVVTWNPQEGHVPATTGERPHRNGDEPATWRVLSAFDPRMAWPETILRPLRPPPGRRATTIHERTCIECGQVFTPTSGGQKTCGTPLLTAAAPSQEPGSRPPCLQTAATSPADHLRRLRDICASTENGPAATLVRTVPGQPGGCSASTATARHRPPLPQVRGECPRACGKAGHHGLRRLPGRSTRPGQGLRTGASPDAPQVWPDYR